MKIKLLIALVSCLALAACNKGTDKEENATPAAEQTTENMQSSAQPAGAVDHQQTTEVTHEVTTNNVAPAAPEATPAAAAPAPAPEAAPASASTTTTTTTTTPAPADHEHDHSHDAAQPQN